MAIANVSIRNMEGLPPELQAAQDAIHLPEVQEMLRRLSVHNLGIFMPHMHDEQTGQFQPLPDDVLQVEAGLEVSFQSAAEFARQGVRSIPVGWVWRAGASAEEEEKAKCVVHCLTGPGRSHDKQHKLEKQ